jgi:hypothetical protein
MIRGINYETGEMSKPYSEKEILFDEIVFGISLIISFRMFLYFIRAKERKFLICSFSLNSILLKLFF